MTANSENGTCSVESVSTSKKRNILDLTGGDGPWQRRIFIVFFFLTIPDVHHYFIMTFLAPEQDYWCSRPAGIVNISKEEWIEYGLPPKDKKCSRYETNNLTIIQNERFNIGVVPCSSWEYDDSFYTATVITEWDLVCEKSWLVSLSESIFMTGVLVAVLCSGNLSDRIGRRPTVAAACILMFLSSIICAFSSSFWMFLIARFFIAMGIGGFYNNLFVLMMEVVSPEMRYVYGNLLQFGWSLGFICFPGIIWFVRDWFWIQITVSALGFIFLFVWWMIPESPRWLLSAGKVEEARQTLLEAAKTNRIDIPNIDLAIDEIIEQSREDFDSKESGGSFLTFLKTPGLWQMTTKIYFAWFVIAFIYYGLSLNTNQHAGDPLVNFAVSGAVELPGLAIAIPAIRFFGRKKTLAWSLIIAGLACLTSCLVPKNITWLSVAVSMVGKLFITCSFSVVYVYTPELFPTTVRNTAMGGASFFVQIGGIIAPFIRELEEFTNMYVPFVIYGVLGATSGIAVLFLPETGNCNMPNTIEDVVKVISRTENVELPPPEKEYGKFQ